MKIICHTFCIQMHKRNVQDRQRIINKLKRQIREKKAENKKYDVDLEEMSVSVVERRNINEVNGKNNLSLVSFHFSSHLLNSSFYSWLSKWVGHWILESNEKEQSIPKWQRKTSNWHYGWVFLLKKEFFDVML